jgi:hypothetical protein
MNFKASGGSSKAEALTLYPHHGGIVTEAQREKLEAVVELTHWFNWDPLKGSPGKLGKAPINFRTGGFGAVNKPETAGTFAQVLGRIPDGGGVGTLLSETPDGFVCLDLDHVIHEGVMHWLGKFAVDFFKGTYIEVSPSGTGLRIFTRGVVDWPHSVLPDPKIIGPITVGRCPSGVDIKFEVYHSQPIKWVRCTGAVLIESSGVVTECQNGIEWVLGEMAKKIAAVAKKGAGSSANSGPVKGGSGDMDELFAQVEELRGTPDKGSDEVLGEILDRVATQPRSKLADACEAVSSLEAAGGELARTNTGSVRSGFANVVQVLRHDPEASGLFGYDLFKGRMYRTKSLVALDSKAETETGPVTDDDYRRVALFLHRKYGMNAKLDDVMEAVKTVARDERFDPVKDALEKLGAAWDGVKRLDGWLVKYMKIDPSTGGEYVRKVSRVLLIQAVQRVLVPGSRAESMPVFIGPGGEGKGKAFQALAGSVLPGLFTNGGFDISSTKDIIEKCRGRLIVEASEMDCVKRARDVAAFKAAMSVQEDTHRKSYEREPEDFKRSFTIWGSANDEEFITDTSNGQGRRVWPLFTMATRSKPIDVKGLESDGGQLWGEAVRALQGGELSYFDENTDTDPRATDQWNMVIERCRVPTYLDDAIDLYLMEWATVGIEWWRSSLDVSTGLGLGSSVSGRIDAKEFHVATELLKAKKLKRRKLGNRRGWEFLPSGREAYLDLAAKAGDLSVAKLNGLKLLKAAK